MAMLETGRVDGRWVGYRYRKSLALANTMQGKRPNLYPAQVCFVVDDVPQAVLEAERAHGWGPFQQFKAPIENATYHDWTGKKTTEVALGMAGNVQVEFLHVHEGHDAIAAYQAKYGTGFQHIGISCKSRDEAAVALEKLGATVDVKDEYPGIKFAFVDVPTGPAMFELLENTAPPPGMKKKDNASEKPKDIFAIDRATIVTADMQACLEFYTKAFRWEDLAPKAKKQRLNIDGVSHQALRCVEKAGQIEFELIQPLGDANPYAAHLKRGAHGLVHAGGEADELPEDAALFGEWLESGERFALRDWAGGKKTLQVRLTP